MKSIETKSIIVLLAIFAGCGGSGDITPASTTALTAGPTAAAVPTPELVPAKIIKCSALTLGLYFKHTIYNLKEGGQIILCSVSDNYGEYSGHNFVLESKENTTAGACSVTADESGAATAGYWVFNSSGSSSTAIYRDVGSTANGAIAILSCTSDAE